MGKQAPLVIVGFGNQAKAWALNLRDSGWSIVIALRKESSSRTLASQMNFELIEIGKALSAFQQLILLIPDHCHLEFLQESQNILSQETRLVYAHGASYDEHNFKKNFPHFSHLLLAPKAIASEVRFQFQTNGKLGACSSLEASLNPQKDSLFLQELSQDLGITGGPYPTTFREEAFADLVSEQSLLCGLLPYAALHSYNILRAKGITPELAFMECWLEVKFIADAMIKMGPESFFQLISPNALIGAEYAQNLFFDKEYQKKLEHLCEQIENGEFFSLAAQTKLPKMRKKIADFWKNTELNKVHQKLAKDLIPESS